MMEANGQKVDRMTKLYRTVPVCECIFKMMFWYVIGGPHTVKYRHKESRWEEG